MGVATSETKNDGDWRLGPKLDYCVRQMLSYCDFSPAPSAPADFDRPMSNVTQILQQVEAGDPAAAELLLPLVYDELRKLAAVRLAQEKPGQTLQATALVHDAYIRLVDTAAAKQWQSRAHFFGAAAEAMRRILIDAARRKQSLKRGGALQRVELGEAAELAPDPGADNEESLLALDTALTALEAEDPEKAKLVKLRFFAGMTIEEAADVLGISRAAAVRRWTHARAWLYGQVSEK